MVDSPRERHRTMLSAFGPPQYVLPTFPTTEMALTVDWQYGGFYGPTFFSHWLDQNELITSGRSPLANATVLTLHTLGLAGACVDSRAMGKGFPLFAHNNTYGIEMYDEGVFEEVLNLIETPDTGCNALIDTCRALARVGDPLGTGLNNTVNQACVAATNVCFGGVQGAVSKFTTVCLNH